MRHLVYIIIYHNAVNSKIFYIYIEKKQNSVLIVHRYYAFIGGWGFVDLLVHSEYVYLATVQPILQLIMRWLGVMLACQMKMQKNIVNLVE